MYTTEHMKETLRDPFSGSHGRIVFDMFWGIPTVVASGIVCLIMGATLCG